MGKVTMMIMDKNTGNNRVGNTVVRSSSGDLLRDES